MKSFSFIIPLFNSQNDLIRCLKSLAGLNYSRKRYEVVLIDDGLNDTSTLSKYSFFGSINLRIYKNISKGAASARNYGISMARNEICVFLDQDVDVDKDILNIYSETFGSNDIHVVQGNIWKQLTLTKLTKMHSKWREISFLNKVQVENNSPYIKTLVTRNVAIHKNVLINIKNKYGFIFNEGFSGTGGEDRDLGYKIYNLGYKIFLEKKAIVKHKDPVVLWEILMQKYRHARGDVRLGIGEKMFDFSNFKRVVIIPTSQGVPFYFCLLIWLFHIAGCEFERLGGIFSGNHHPWGLKQN